jgi:DNA-binding CsgD family transcriptional regulator
MNNEPVMPDTELTLKEKEVLKSVWEGHPAKQVARALGITAKAVKCHKTNMFTRMRTNDLIQLIRKALKEGWIHADLATPKEHMTWSRDKPMRSGFYWVRRTDTPLPYERLTVLEIRNVKGRLKAWEHGEWSPLREFIKCEWAGPVEPPKEAKAVLKRRGKQPQT